MSSPAFVWDTGDGGPPPDEPLCGYRADLCPEDHTRTHHTRILAPAPPTGAQGRDLECCTPLVGRPSGSSSAPPPSSSTDAGPALPPNFTNQHCTLLQAE